MGQDGSFSKHPQVSRTAVAAVAGVAAVAMVCGSASTAQIPHASQASATTRSPVACWNHRRGQRPIANLLNGQVQKLKKHELLEEIQSLLTNSAPNLRECMVALNALGQRKLWRESISLMESMACRRVQPDQFLFNKLISICAKSKEGLPAWNLLGSMRQRRLFPDVLACNMVINALASSGLWEKVLGVLDSMQGCRTMPDEVSVNSAISACAQGSRWMQAIQFLDEGQRLSIAPDVTTYGATMQACETQWKLVLHLLDEMQNKKIQPNEIISAATVRACAKGSPELSTELFASLKEKGIRQNKFSYSAAIGACHVDQYLWPWSLWYLQEMKTDGIEIDIGIMNGVMSACQEAHQWGHLQKRDIRLVEQLLDDVRYLQLVPDIMTYSHVMAAARKAGDWERVLWLLKDVSIQNLRPDGALYTHAISACAKGWRWQHALGLLATANVCGSLEYHWSSAMAACADSTQWEHAIALAPQMQELGLQPEVVTYTALACAYVQGGHWPVAFELLAMMQDNGEEPNHIMLTSVIRSCMPRRNFALAVNWKAQMEKIGVQPYLTTYVCLIALAAEAQQWKWVQYLLAESNVRYPMAENFDIRQLYNLVLLKCLKFGQMVKAVDFWKDYVDSGISSINAMLTSCEDSDFKEYANLCEELGPASWAQTAKEAAWRAEAALARGKYTGHGPGWQRDALGEVALTLDLLAWHGLSALKLESLFAENVFEFVLEAIMAEIDPSILNKAATGRTHTRLREPILKGSQLQNVMLSSRFTKQALESLDLSVSEKWLFTGRLQARRALPVLEEAGDGIDTPARGFRTRWISFRPSKQCPEGQENRGVVVLGADAGCKDWLAPVALDNALTNLRQEHGQLLQDLVQATGIRHGKVRMYMSYTPCLACLAKMFQLKAQGLACQVAFDTWRETRHWTSS